MSVQDSAQQLISAANSYVETAVGLNNAASEAVGSSISGMEQVRLTTTGSLAAAVVLMGDGHPAVRGIVASSMEVNRKADEIDGLLQQARTEIAVLDQLAAVHGETMAMIGRQLMQGGS